MGMEKTKGSREGMEPAAHQEPGAADGDARAPGGARGDGARAIPGNRERRTPAAEEPEGRGEPPTEPGEPAASSTSIRADEADGDSNGPAGHGSSGGGEEAGPAGLARLSLPARIFVAITVAVVAVAVAVHVTMVFLHVAPDNTVSRQHSDAVDDYVLPEFEQNWKLFAPNPLQQNVAVHARAAVTKDDGNTETTGWVNLTALDGAAVRGNPAPSHTQQNELRRAWEFYANYHDDKSRPVGLRGRLSEQYMKRIVMRRFGTRLNGGSVERIQLRSAITPVKPPPWSQERMDLRTKYAVQPWWPVTSADLPGSDS